MSFYEEDERLTLRSTTGMSLDERFASMKRNQTSLKKQQQQTVGVKMGGVQQRNAASRQLLGSRGMAMNQRRRGAGFIQGRAQQLAQRARMSVRGKPSFRGSTRNGQGFGEGYETVALKQAVDQLLEKQTQMEKQLKRQNNIQNRVTGGITVRREHAPVAGIQRKLLNQHLQAAATQSQQQHPQNAAAHSRLGAKGRVGVPNTHTLQVTRLNTQRGGNQRGRWIRGGGRVFTRGQYGGNAGGFIQKRQQQFFQPQFTNQRTQIQYRGRGGGYNRSFQQRGNTRQFSGYNQRSRGGGGGGWGRGQAFQKRGYYGGRNY